MIVVRAQDMVVDENVQGKLLREQCAQKFADAKRKRLSTNLITVELVGVTRIFFVIVPRWTLQTYVPALANVQENLRLVLPPTVSAQMVAAALYALCENEPDDFWALVMTRIAKDDSDLTALRLLLVLKYLEVDTMRSTASKRRTCTSRGTSSTSLGPLATSMTRCGCTRDSSPRPSPHA